MSFHDQMPLSAFPPRRAKQPMKHFGSQECSNCFPADLRVKTRQRRACAIGCLFCMGRPSTSGFRLKHAYASLRGEHHRRISIKQRTAAEQARIQTISRFQHQRRCFSAMKRSVLQLQLFSLLVHLVLGLQAAEHDDGDAKMMTVSDNADDDQVLRAALALLSKHRLVRGSDGSFDDYVKRRHGDAGRAKRQRVIIPYREAYIWG